MNSTMVIALVAMVLAIMLVITVRTAMSKSNRAEGRRRKRVGSSFVGTTGASSNHDAGWGGFDGGGIGG
ncbi:hypothetical protein E1161_26810, partial [Saccharopolyspora aridisoli]